MVRLSSSKASRVYWTILPCFLTGLAFGTKVVNLLASTKMEPMSAWIHKLAEKRVYWTQSNFTDWGRAFNCLTFV